MNKLYAKFSLAGKEIRDRAPSLLQRCNALYVTFMSGPFMGLLDKAKLNGGDADAIAKTQRGVANICRRLSDPDNDDPQDTLHNHLLIIKELFSPSISDEDLEELRRKQYAECLYKFVLVENGNNNCFAPYRFRKWVGVLSEDDRIRIYNTMRVWALCAAILAFVPRAQLRSLEKLLHCDGDPDAQRQMDLRIMETLYCLTMLFDSITLDGALSTIHAILQLWVKKPDQRELLQHECKEKLRPFLRKYWDEYQDLVAKADALLANRRNSASSQDKKKGGGGGGMLQTLRDKCIGNVMGINMLVNRMASEYTQDGEYKLESVTSEQFSIVAQLSEHLQNIALNMMRDNLNLNWELLSNTNVLALFSFLAAEIFHVDKDELKDEICELGNDVKSEWSDLAKDFMVLVEDEDLL